MTRADAVLAAGFVLVAAAEAVALRRSDPGLLVLGCCGAPVLSVLAVRRTRPLVPVCVIGGFAVLGTALQLALRPEAEDSGGVWLFALMLACYSLGAHGRGRPLLLGALVPLTVVLTADLPTRHGWSMVNGIVFVTLFVGVLPTAVGAVVRRRRERVALLEAQRDRIVLEQRAERRSAVLAERLRTTERLQTELLEGLQSLARSVDAGADAPEIETTARSLLARTREQVLALTAPVDPPADVEPPGPADADRYLVPLRAAAQPWAVIAGGALGVGLALESMGASPSAVPGWVAVLAGLAAGVPVAVMGWRPLSGLVATWAALTTVSQLVTPLDGTLSGSGAALTVSFAVAALSTRRAAVAGLVLCCLGQAFGVGTDDPVGDAAIFLFCWLGGMAVNEATRLVEATRVNNDLLAAGQGALSRRAVVDERLRLARELHDILGHTLTVVALQAGATRRIEAIDPQRAAEARAAIAVAAHEGVASLADLGGGSIDVLTLLERTRSAGLDLHADLDALSSLDAGTAQVVRRVLREALTNVLRHAPGARATVLVRLTYLGVEVVVTNSAAGRPGAGPGTGHGLLGIRESVTACSGRVTWGPVADGGFELRAALPVTAPAGVPG